MIIYNFDTVLPDGPMKGKTVRDAFDNDRHFVFDTIKQWAADKVKNKEFSDDVLAEARITKTIVPGSVTIQQEELIVPRTVVIDENGKVRRKKKQDVEDEWTKDEKYFYGPNYDGGTNDDKQDWGDDSDDEDDEW